MKFRIEQVALAPYSAGREKAIKLLQDLGLTDWVHDQVVAKGTVFGVEGKNVAALAFNYQANGGNESIGGKLELEVLNYEDGPNWIDESILYDTVSHLGMHCTAEELAEFRAYFDANGYEVAQEVITESHTNPHIAGKRRYQYVIFNTRGVIGVDLKFIVRLNPDGTPYTAPLPITDPLPIVQ